MSLLEAIVKIRNLTILWKKGGEVEVLREINQLTKEALDEYCKDIKRNS